MAGSMEALSTLLDQKFGEHLGPIRKDIEEVKETIQTHDGRISKLEEALSSGQSSRFVASFVEVRGICEWKDRKASGISRPEAENMTRRLTGAFPDGVLWTK